MNKRLYWGLPILAIVIGVAFLFVKQQADISELRQELAETDKQSDHPIAVGDQPPPAEPGFKWVRHGDHWDKIPVDKLISDLDLTDEKPDLQTISLTPVQVDLKSLREKMTALDEELLAEDLAKHQKRVDQYKKEYASWLENVEQTHNEWMQLTQIDRKTAEEYAAEIEHIQSLTDAERKVVIAKNIKDYSHYQSVSKRLRALLENEPVFSLEPGTN